MRLSKKTLTAVLISAGCLALGLRIVFFGISVVNVPESSDESLSTLQAKIILEEGRMPLLVMANPYQFPAETYLQLPLMKILPRNAFGARLVPFLLSLAATAVFIAILFLIAPLKTNWPALLLLLFPSAYVLMLGSAYFIPQHSSFTLLSTLALYLTFRIRTYVSPALLALAAGFCAGLAFSNHMLAMSLLVVLSAYVVLGPKRTVQLRVIPAFTVGVGIGLIPYFLAIWLLPGSYAAVAGIVSCGVALERLWDMTLNFTLAGVMGITPCFFPDNRQVLTLIPRFTRVFAVLWIVIMLSVIILRAFRFIRRIIANRWLTLEVNDVFLGLALLGFMSFLFSARSLSHTYRYLLPVAMAFPFLVSYLYARAPKLGRVLVGAFVVFLAVFNIAVSLALMREWARPGFAAKEANLVDLKPAIQYLDSRGIRYAYASYWLSYRVTYETDGRIMCSQPYNERFPGWPMPYKKEVDVATNVAYLALPGLKYHPRRFEDDFAAMAVGYHREICGKVSVYTDFKLEKPIISVPVPRGNIRVSVSHNQDRAALLTDGNSRTCWQVTNVLKRDVWIQLDLPEQQTLNRVVMAHIGFPPEGLGVTSVLARTETGWVDVGGANLWDRIDRFVFRNGHPVYGEQFQTMTFPPFEADSLRFMLRAPTENCKRAIGEVKLYQVQP